MRLGQWELIKLLSECAQNELERDVGTSSCHQLSVRVILNFFFGPRNLNNLKFSSLFKPEKTTISNQEGNGRRQTRTTGWGLQA
jgi:hypothetical protein